MVYLFIIQGEGRGHMTQAIALASILRKHGHLVNRVIVGRSDRRSIPDFFTEGIEAAIDQVDSPNFVTDDSNKSVNIFKSFTHTIGRLGTYKSSMEKIHEVVSEEQPDVIINFFDFIGGLYNYLKRPKVKFVCIAHQYLSDHSTFEFPIGRWLDRRSMYLGNRITSLKAHGVLALSFRELADEPGIAVVPPLLRKVVQELVPSQGNHLLVYMLNHGYHEEVDLFHKEFPEVNIHCFWDKSDAPETLKIDGTLTYHQLNSELFLKYMASSKGFLTTAGFESICEAIWLGKPVLMMPVQGHYEQSCNALDAKKSGAGISSDTFDLKLLVDYIPTHTTDPENFRRWSDRAEDIFIEKLTSL